MNDTLDSAEIPRSEAGPTRRTLPRIAIVGRPNVGKSTLTNRMAGRRISIVEPTAGVTRDRISVPSRVDTGNGDRWYELIDTGGVGIVDRHDLGPHVEEQVRTALDSAELILFLVDVRDGLTPLDRTVADRLRGVEQPVILVANKVEGDRLEFAHEEFRSLGMGDEIYPISAQNGVGLSPLYRRIGELLPSDIERDDWQAPTMKLAVVGRRNAGKSTFVNALAGEERVIVSEIPGTTRDSIDVIFERDGRSFVVVDTAGVRKKSKLEDAIEFYSEARARKAIRKADLVLLMFDGTEPLSGLDKRLAREITDAYKPVILAANKWDLLRDETEYEDMIHDVRIQLPGMSWAPVVTLSAKEGRGVWETLQLAQEVFDEGRARVPTWELNKILKKATEARSPSKKGHRVRILYATQAETSPPSIVVFVNDRRLIGKEYVRYLQNRLREELPFDRVPVQIVIRDRKEDSRRNPYAPSRDHA